MRILKKIIKKLYHLIWFLGAFILFSPDVNALTTIDGANYTQPAFVAFADNTNGHLTRIGTTWVDYGSYYRSDSLITNGAAYYGANWGIYADIPFVQGHTYALSVLIGMANSFAVVNNSSRARMCIAEGINNAFERYNNPGTFPCFTAWANSVNTKAGYVDDNGVTYQYTVVSYVFTADFTSNGITGSYNSQSYNESNHTFGGYYVEEISAQPLTQSQVQQAVQNSGLATASSVSQVQQSINQVKQELSGVQQEQQQTNQKLDDVNDNLTDETAPTLDLSDLEVSSDTPISDLITMPLTILNSLSQALDSTCSNYTIPFLFNSSVTFPCFTISDYLGNTVTNYIDLFICFYMCYNIAMLVVSVFEDITSLRDIYDSLYVPKHADSGYQPKHAKGGGS